MRLNSQQAASGHSSHKTRILAGKMFNSDTMSFSKNQVIVVDTEAGLISDVRDWNEGEEEQWNSNFIDLRKMTVLPGFVDAHVHMFLHAYNETSWDNQQTQESYAERVIRATVHAKKTLMAGFTTVRDLGTEGVGDADIALRKCLSGPEPLISGPRYFCANKAIVASGSYGPKSSIHPSQEGIDGVVGAEAADGIDGCVKAVRKQIGTGADWIKIYADYRPRSRMLDVSLTTAARLIPTFAEPELAAMINTAHSYGVKIAAHANTLSSFKTLLSLGIDSIEHCVQDYNSKTSTNSNPIDDLFSTWSRNHSKTFWVPTLAVYHKFKQYKGGNDPKANGDWDRTAQMFKRALELGFERIACGGDTGAFTHGENALEMKLMVELGADPKKVLRWATLSGWECLRGMYWETTSDSDVVGDNDVRFGCIKKGWAADIVALDSDDVESEFDRAVDRVIFVMKGGKVYKGEGAS